MLAVVQSLFDWCLGLVALALDLRETTKSLITLASGLEDLIKSSGWLRATAKSGVLICLGTLASAKRRKDIVFVEEASVQWIR